MYLFLFCLFIIAIVAVTLYFIPVNDVVISNGYRQYPTNPIYFSGNKCMRNKKTNMLRLSKMRRK